MEKLIKPCGLCKLVSAILSIFAFILVTGILTLILTQIPNWFNLEFHGLFLLLFAATASATCLIPACLIAQRTYDYFEQSEKLNERCAKIDVRIIYTYLLALIIQIFLMWSLYLLSDKIFGNKFISENENYFYGSMFVIGIFMYFVAYEILVKYLYRLSLREWRCFIGFYLGVKYTEILNDNGNTFGVPK